MEENKSEPQIPNANRRHRAMQSTNSSGNLVAPVIVSNPKGILRAIGRFKDDPMLDEWAEAMKELREVERIEAVKAA